MTMIEGDWVLRKLSKALAAIAADVRSLEQLSRNHDDVTSRFRV